MQSQFQSLSRIGILTVFLLLFDGLPVHSRILERLPLQPLSSGEGDLLFSEVQRSWSGLASVNSYDDPSMWGERFLEFTLGAIGTGVAIGDYDRDGLPDLFIANKTGRDELYRNLGDFRFEAVADQAGVGGESGVWTQGAAFADCDGDGWLDLYVCRYDAPNLLYMNNGDGTFREVAESSGVAASDASGMVSFADYDQDGDLDFYLLTNMLSIRDAPKGQPDRLYRNNGYGHFEEVTHAAGISGQGQGHSATWIDYNQDGFPDLYVANDFTPADILYHNTGDGRFVDALSYVVARTPNSSMGADIVDLNRDGLMDFMVADMAARRHVKDMRGMVNGREEAVDPISNPFAAQQYPRNAVFVNSGMGPFLEGANLMGLAATDWTWSVRFEDLDNDGWDDLHVTTGMVRELHNTDLMKRVREARSPAQRIALVKASPPLAEPNLAFRNLGDFRFHETGAEWGLDEVGVSFGAAFGDLDRDGDLDLAYANFEKGVSLLRNDSSSGHRILIELRGVESNRYGVGAAVSVEAGAGRQTKQLSLSRGYASTSEPILHFGLGPDQVVSKVKIRWPSGSVQELKDLESGYLYRIQEEATPELERNPVERPLRFVEKSRDLNLLHRTEERFVFERKDQPFLPKRHNRVGPALAVGDLNSDGRDDLVVGGTPSDPATVFIREAGGGFVDGQPLPERGGPTNDGAVLIFDANSDDAEDVFVAAGGVNALAGSESFQPALWLNEGAGGFSKTGTYPLPPFPVSVTSAACADFDRDGDLDLFLGGSVVPGSFPEAPRSGLFRNDGDGFSDVTRRLANGLERVGMVADARWSDVNGDGWPDLVVACDWGPVKCFVNKQGQAFEDASGEFGFDSAGFGWWNSIAAGDFNFDGKIDYAFGNDGLNTGYAASKERPATLFYGPFAAGGKTHLVEAKYEDERLLPVRGFEALKKRIPGLSKAFAGNNAYSLAHLEEIVGERFLGDAQRFEADRLSSGVLMSGPGKAYAFESLPRLAQIAPLQGMAAGDFDGDGDWDLFAVQNDFTPTPSAGRFDGGLGVVLLGDGKGGFSALLPHESGLLVTGDGRALCVADFNDDSAPDFFLSRNHSSLLAYANESERAAGFLRVALHGRRGNRSGIGALVTLRTSDGKRFSQEIYGGGGGLGQSSRYAFFALPRNGEGSLLTVNWPDGEETQLSVEPGRTRITVFLGD